MDIGFDEFAAAETARLLGLTRVLCGNDHDAWDLTQDALARVSARWGSARPPRQRGGVRPHDAGQPAQELAAPPARGAGGRPARPGRGRGVGAPGSRRLAGHRDAVAAAPTAGGGGADLLGGPADRGGRGDPRVRGGDRSEEDDQRRSGRDYQRGEPPGEGRPRTRRRPPHRRPPRGAGSTTRRSRSRCGHEQGSLPSQPVSYVLGDGGDIAAILWATHHPLVSPPAAHRSNKILWVARVGATEGPLEIRATLVSTGETVTRTVEGAPGPSTIDLAVGRLLVARADVGQPSGPPHARVRRRVRLSGSRSFASAGAP